jgi:hypothetical protein
MEASLATTAESYSLKRGPARPPISTHPAFPAIVALWFAALLGLGSLVLPIALLERLVTVTGIAALVPSAAPPLGFTAHAGIALAGAIAGAALGLLLARKIAQAHAAEPITRSFVAADEGPRRPISAHDELGEEGLAPASGMSPLSHKRRSLALAEDNRRSTYLETVPLPGHSDGAPLDPVANVAEPISAEEPLHNAPTEPLELGEFSDLDEAEDIAPEPETDPALEALRSRIHTSDEPAFQDQPMTDSYSFEPSNDQGDDGQKQTFQPFAKPQSAADTRDPLPFAPPSLRRLDPTAFDEDEADEVEDTAIEEDTGPQLSVVEFAEPDFNDDGWEADRPLEELGLVQLAARLGASLKKRKALAAAESAVAAPALAPIAAADDFVAAEPEEAARAMADFFAPGAQAAPADETLDREPEAPVAPAPLRSFALDDEEDADDEAIAASFSLPLGATPTSVSPVFGEDDEIGDEADEAEEDDGEYSSLLEMKNPFVRQQEFVRIEEPEIEDEAFEPTVTFPQSSPMQPAEAAKAPADAFSRPFDPPLNPANSAASATPRDAGDAERSLRDALATLQRMSGAA